jgi:predicted DCC family thiol-disulfide oxidoreductase YuxK
MTHDPTAAPLEPWQVEVFFDGDCPLCRKEVAWFRKLDRRQRILFTDLATDVHAVTASGIPFDQLMAEIHGRLPDGTWVRGVEVFRRMYSTVGWRWLVAPTRWPGVRQVLDWAYRVFARNRLRMTGRCTSECKLHQH